jgi:hypothetical protein
MPGVPVGTVVDSVAHQLHDDEIVRQAAMDHRRNGDAAVRLSH